MMTEDQCVIVLGDKHSKRVAHACIQEVIIAIRTSLITAYSMYFRDLSWQQPLRELQSLASNSLAHVPPDHANQRLLT